MEVVKKSLRDSNLMRWSVLLIVSFIMAVNYFFYDVLSPLQSLLRDKLGFSNSEYGFLVAAYSLPNVFLLMAIIGGIILDKIGIRITGFLFIAFMAIGSILTGYGSSSFFNNGGPGFHFLNTFLVQYSPALKLMTFGYFMFGLGAETSIVVITKIVVKWFKGRELAFALGINLAVARTGTMMAFLFSNSLAQQNPWYKPIFLGAVLLCIGLLAFIIYTLFDLKIDRQLHEDTITASEEKFRISDIGKIVKIPSFIYITLLCVTFYSAVFPFLKYAPDMLENKFGFSGELSGLIVAILPFGTIIFTPLFGLFTDYRGKSASVMILGSFLLILVHLMFTFTRIYPYIPMFILGVAFSLVPAAMWPSVAKIIENNKIGTAYGIMFSIQNIGLWAFPIIIGFVLDYTNPFYDTEINHKDFEKIVNNEFQYSGRYFKNRHEPFINQSFKAKVTVYEDDSVKSIVWQESHQVKSDNSGYYDVTIASGGVIDKVDPDLMNFAKDTVRISIIEIGSQYDTSILDSIVKFEKVIPIDLSSKIKSDDDSLKIIISANTIKHKILWIEEQKAKKVILNGGRLKVGDGRIVKVDKELFNWNDNNLSMEIQVPINYSKVVLLLSFLGILGLIFALLLKREDKTSGYGLELPNKQPND